MEEPKRNDSDADVEIEGDVGGVEEAEGAGEPSGEDGQVLRVCAMQQ